MRMGGGFAVLAVVLLGAGLTGGAQSAGRPLPEAAAAEIRRDESTIEEAWTTSLEDDATLRAALEAARSALLIRRAHQGADWWQTVDAHISVVELERLIAAPPEARRALARALADREDLAAMHQRGELAEGLAKAREIEQAVGRVLGEAHPARGAALAEIAAFHDALRQPKEAYEQESQARDVLARSLGERHPSYADSLRQLARRILDPSLIAVDTLDRAGVIDVGARYARAEGWLLQAIAISIHTAGTHALDTADGLEQLARLYTAQARYHDAEPVFRTLLDVRGAMLGERHPDYAVTLNDLALLLASTERGAAAEPMYRQALGVFDPATPEGVAPHATILDNLAGLQRMRGNFVQAEQLYVEAIALRRREPTQSSYAISLNNLAVLYVAMGRFEEAESRTREAMAILETLHATGGQAYASMLDALAAAKKSRGLYEQAEPDYLHALKIRKTLLGDRHPDYARSLNNLGNLESLEGDLARAISYFRSALDVWRRAVGERHPDYAVTTINLAQALYDADKKSPEAEPLFEQALAILRETRNQSHPAYVAALNNFATVLAATDRPDRAETLLVEAAGIVTQTLGDRTPALATLRNNLADLYMRTGAADRAEPLYRQALAIRERAIGKEHPAYAMSLTGIGSALAAMQRPEGAAFLLDSAGVDWQHLTRNFPTMSPQGKEAFLKHSAFDQGARLTTMALRGGLASPPVALEGVLFSKHLLFEVSRHESAALLTTVRNAPEKWQALWQERQAIRRRYADGALHSTVAREGAGDGSVAARGAPQSDGHSRESSLTSRINEIEEALRRYPEYERLARAQQVSLADVRRALRPRDALIEFVDYPPYDFKNGRPEEGNHYAAYVMRGDHAPIVVHDLGAKSDIDTLVGEFRALIAKQVPDLSVEEVKGGPVRRDEADLAGKSVAVREAVWDPLLTSLQGVDRVYIAPDGELSLVPFEALARATEDGGWEYLAEERDREFIYVGTGRDLARFVLEPPAIGRHRNAVLIGDPDFDASPQRTAEEVAVLRGMRPPPAAAGGSAASSARARASAAASSPCVSLRTGWTRPLGLDTLLADVGRQLRDVGWNVTIIDRERAVEEQVLAVSAPAILQFATHGTYVTGDAHISCDTWNPLLRSMLIFAGMNKWTPGESVYYEVDGALQREHAASVRTLPEEKRRAARVEIADGMLTAYEVSGLNLSGTELVNLTACHTGEGVIGIDGVAGLRQAFLLAGARSVTMSMWEMPAIETAAQMKGFYAGGWLSDGMQAPRVTRYAAFRAAQRDALTRARKDRQSGHPFYWAGSIYVGDPGDLGMAGLPGTPIRALPTP